MSKKHYVVWQGVKPGIYTLWAEAKAQIDGRSDAQYMGFPSQTEAEQAYGASYTDALKKRGKTMPTGANNNNNNNNNNSNSTGKSAGKNKSSRKAKSSAAKPLIIADINIYSDGACSPNPGKAGTGIAIYHKDQAKILWYGLYEANGTNNSAELHGLLKGLQIAEHYLKQQVTVQVLSDSKYAIDCITKWAKGWKNKSWTRGQGEAIKNLDLIKQCFALYEQISSQVTISHVKGHANIEGNELADRMAVYARKTQESSFVRYDEAFDVSTVLAMTSG